jgi:beta-lactamase regulating signal transducer with metallopeptidase domain
MEWQLQTVRWLLEAGVGGLLLLALASFVVRYIRQPARQLLLIEWTFIACFTAPWLHLIPGLPTWSLGWLPSSRPAAVESVADASPGGGLHRNANSGSKALGDAGGAVSGKDVRSSSGMGLTWSHAVVALYAAGAAWVLLQWLVGIMQLVRLRRTAESPPARAHEILLEIAGPHARRARLLASPRIDTPIAIGWRRPMIVLPQALCLPGNEPALRYALAHEWNHIERLDVVVWRLTALVQVLFFYQPLFWRLRRQLRLCQDFLADAQAARQGAAVEDYADYLVSVAMRRTKAPPLPALAFSERRSDLYRRVVMLVHCDERLENGCRACWHGAVGAAAVLLTLGIAALRLEAEEAVGKSSAPQQIFVHGRISDHDTGQPIAGATVVVRRREALAGHSRVLQESLHRTDVNGEYAFSLLPRQLASPWLYLEIDAEHPQYAAKCGVSCSLNDVRRVKATPDARPDFAAIRLRRGETATAVVESVDGRPVAGLDVVAYSSSDGRPWLQGSFSRARTDAEGRFRIVLASSGDSVICLLPPNSVPLLCVVHQRRGDLGRFRIPSPVAGDRQPRGASMLAATAGAR